MAVASDFDAAVNDVALDGDTVVRLISVDGNVLEPFHCGVRDDDVDAIGWGVDVIVVAGGAGYEAAALGAVTSIGKAVAAAVETDADEFAVLGIGGFFLVELGRGEGADAVGFVRGEFFLGHGWEGCEEQGKQEGWEGFHSLWGWVMKTAGVGFGELAACRVTFLAANWDFMDWGEGFEDFFGRD